MVSALSLEWCPAWRRTRRRTRRTNPRRAEDAGCEAVVLTVDVPWMGRRRRDVRNRFVLPGHVRAANLTTTAAAPWTTEPAAGDTAHRRLADASAVAEHTSRTFSSSLTWASVEVLRRSTRLPLVLKGVLSPEDALRAAECGCDAVVVSNHGGRQLDGAVPSIDALAGLVSAVGATCEVLPDSGVRGGTDVLKALAMGAHGVLVGRPVIWGLSTAGEAGVRQVLELLADELRDALGLSGCGGVDEARRLRAVR
ncbi:alpha-hydroxy acid oxidase [Streptomyces daliensis]|uniref:Alpha-hydroxy-acid oxidizing protein n=1 Tax=Streptomyces daliensis TaxID=299421 RepID=A0A8T4IGQ3_9ACTN|nr:alpha-hydroxy-acid oxidizing protein [Streptomyces daliensis]